MKKRKRGENEEDKQERGQGQDGGVDVLAWSDQARMVCEKAFVVCFTSGGTMGADVVTPSMSPREAARLAKEQGLKNGR